EMAEHREESLLEKITEKFHGGDSSSVMDSDDDKSSRGPSAGVKAKIYRLFGREKPVHKVLGGGKRTICLSRPHVPEVSISEDLAVNTVLSLRYVINRRLVALRGIASGPFVALCTVPVLYERYEDRVDAFAEKAEAEFKKHYVVIHVKYLSKIPMGPLKDTKFQ
ncbi:hypothetical protein B296_00025263, partial [Ensete ventricosum]